MPEAFKEALLNKETIGRFAGYLNKADERFDPDRFMEKVFDPSWKGLELKERLHHIALVLKEFLPAGYRPALEILHRAAAQFTEGAFFSLAMCEFVALYGLDDWEASLPALGQFTCLCSAEFAVRPFIVKDPERMMAQMLLWAHSPIPQQRRLASEGCRPRLPWGIGLPAFKADPALILPILEVLKTDQDENVRRSVANNLNDIAKDHPELVIEILRNWQAEDIPAFKEIATRALRTLVKNGDPDALELTGFRFGGEFEVRDFKIEPAAIPTGGEVRFSFKLHSTSESEQNVVVDYTLHLARANGKQSPKVFKLAKVKLAAGETVSITRKYSFQEVTTRRYYPGAHAIEIQVNGVSCARGEFQVE